MNERVKFIAAYLENEDTFADLCERFEVSRKTGYKWVERYEAGGVAALEDQSRAPHSNPLAVTPAVRDALIAVRRRRPRWGVRKLLVVLRREQPDLRLPSPSTAHEILRRRGLVEPRRRVRHSIPHGTPLGGYTAPNSIWCADFKGHFRVGAQRCHPLTITDGFSRFLLKCRGLPNPLGSTSKRIFEDAFREYGLPDAIRTDNGTPFSTLALGGLSSLAVWWIRLGIRHERIAPGRPDQNGRHERMHATLKAETAHPPRSSMRAQQRAFNEFVADYNNVRPHEALGQNTPASLYRPSLRRFPDKLPEPEYPKHFILQRAFDNGGIQFQGTSWYLSTCLRHQLVGLEEVGDGCWKLHFGHVPLGILDLEETWLCGRHRMARALPLDGSLPRRYKSRHA